MSVVKKEFQFGSQKVIIETGRIARQANGAVMVYMGKQGISKERVLLSPLGEELPILGNSISERSINRRVELMLLDSIGRPLALEIQPKQTDFNPPLPVR